MQAETQGGGKGRTVKRKCRAVLGIRNSHWRSRKTCTFAYTVSPSETVPTTMAKLSAYPSVYVWDDSGLSNNIFILRMVKKAFARNNSLPT